MISNKLEEILETKRQEIVLLKEKNSRIEIKRKTTKSFKTSLKKNELTIIAEIKRKSPSKGHFSDISDPIALAQQYYHGGASALSVLTDESYFSGSIKDLEKISNEFRDIDIPILRKDFVLDESQIIEAISAGADAILLIVTALQTKTKLLLDFAKSVNIDALVEVYDENELNLALEAGAEIIAVNNRNLRTFEVNIDNCRQLIKFIPDHVVSVAASGIGNANTARELYELGYDAILVGEALVKSEDPAKLIKEMRNI